MAFIPGWQVGDKPSFTDPREPGPSKEEVGRGALGLGVGILRAVSLISIGVILELEIDGVGITQTV